VVPVLANRFYMGVFRGVQDALSDSDYDLLVFTPSHPEEIKDQLHRALQQGRSDGLLLLSTTISPDIEGILDDADQPVVLLDTKHPGFPSISIDNEQGGYEATRHLLEQGYRRVAHITTDTPEPPPATQRRTGYQRALADAGNGARPLIARGEKEPFAFEREGGYKAMRTLLRREETFDAVFAASDMQALGALRALEEQGLRVPEDVALVGFDDLDLSSYVGLTTLRQPRYDLGVLAVEQLIGRVRDPGRSVSETVFSPELVVRESCGATSSESAIQPML
jgi:LacI family transcriptional regulator